MFKVTSFWQSETIHNITKEVSEELGVSFDDVTRVIKHMFLSVKQELTNPLNLNKVLLHHFGSFFTKEPRILARLRLYICKYREGKITKEELRDKTTILFHKRREFKQINKSKINQNVTTKI